LRVRAGEVLGIVGESGCGKSTLARLILGSLPPNAGHILVEGCDLRTLDRRARARLIQPVFQDPYSSLNPAHRVRDIVRLPLAAQGDMAKRAQTNAVAEVLERVGLSVAIGDRYPAELSGGQRQRVAIARALVLKPRIVVCDEPTSALDVSVQAQVLNLLAQLQRELGLTLIFISHNLGVVDHIASRVAVMYLGRIVELAPADALFETPRHPYTRVLLSSVLTPEAGKGIPEIALGHHEKLNGRGYPRAVTAEAIPVQTRMMTISDIFDALTAGDRPYKRAVPWQRALDILRMEATEGMLDRHLLNSFIDARIFESVLRPHA